MEPGGRGAGNLPAELTSFVGRRDEVAEVRRLLSESRLVTLTGVGGVGKTRLALRAAAGLARAFSDGVWLVQLDQLRAEAPLPQAVAATLGLRQRDGDSWASSLAEHLAGRQLLLVLDNCEHLVNAVAKLVDLLLRAAPGLRVLATSREALNIAGETVLPVPPLAAPEPGQPLTLAELGLFPAVRLFAERAAQAVPGFSVTEANMTSVARICGRLEGLPLALELAAARARVLSPEQIDARLGDRLGLLTRGSRTNPARQRTLRTSIEWSYELCSGPEQLLWERLSVFADGFELDAVEGICADHRLAAKEVLELLAALADKSVLIAEHVEQGVRYRLAQTLREYGQERLQSAGDCTALRRRHRDWHEQLARQFDAGWHSPRAADLMARLFREHANVRAAQDFCLNEPGEAEAALRIALYVWRLYYWSAGYIGEGRHRLDQVLARVTEATTWRAQGLLLAGLLAAVSGDHEPAQALLAEGTGLAQRLDDQATRAFAAYCAGTACLCAGDLAQALSRYEDGLATLTAAANRDRLRAVLLAALAGTAALAEDEGRVTACDRELAALAEASDDLVRRWYTASSRWVLGLMAWHRGDLHQAADLHLESLRSRDVRTDRLGVAYCLEALAWTAASGHQHERAAVLLGAADGLWRAMGLTLDGQQHLAGYHRDCERQARRVLGEAAFQAARDRGLQLPAEDVLGYAVRRSPSPDEPTAPPAAAPEPPAPPLTRRETQVARLVSEGNSNKEIAAALVISQRTAEGHVEHILAKLGFTSRAQIAAWIAASQPKG
jgi:predicted ATPase/DNA-binding CsgD family transcriptional regulator